MWLLALRFVLIASRITAYMRLGSIIINAQFHRKVGIIYAKPRGFFG